MARKSKHTFVEWQENPDFNNENEQEVCEPDVAVHSSSSDLANYSAKSAKRVDKYIAVQSQQKSDRQTQQVILFSVGGIILLMGSFLLMPWLSSLSQQTAQTSPASPVSHSESASESNMACNSGEDCQPSTLGGMIDTVNRFKQRQKQHNEELQEVMNY